MYKCRNSRDLQYHYMYFSCIQIFQFFSKQYPNKDTSQVSHFSVHSVSSSVKFTQTPFEKKHLKNSQTVISYLPFWRQYHKYPNSTYKTQLSRTATRQSCCGRLCSLHFTNNHFMLSYKSPQLLEVPLIESLIIESMRVIMLLSNAPNRHRLHESINQTSVQSSTHIYI